MSTLLQTLDLRYVDARTAHHGLAVRHEHRDADAGRRTLDSGGLQDIGQRIRHRLRTQRVAEDRIEATERALDEVSLEEELGELGRTQTSEGDRGDSAVRLAAARSCMAAFRSSPALYEGFSTLPSRAEMMS